MRFSKSNLYGANLELIFILVRLVQNNPQMRFSQILVNFGFVKNELQHDDVFITKLGPWKDEFYLESKDLLKRIKFRLEELDYKIE